MWLRCGVRSEGPNDVYIYTQISKENTHIHLHSYVMYIMIET